MKNIVSYLLEHEADANITNDNGHGVLDLITDEVVKDLFLPEQKNEGNSKEDSVSSPPRQRFFASTDTETLSIASSTMQHSN